MKLLAKVSVVVHLTLSAASGIYALQAFMLEGYTLGTAQAAALAAYAGFAALCIAAGRPAPAGREKELKTTLDDLIKSAEVIRDTVGHAGPEKPIGVGDAVASLCIIDDSLEQAREVLKRAK